MRARGPVLGLDYGTRRIGIAISEAETGLAFPAGCLERTAPQRDLKALSELIGERKVVRVVVGLPLHMDGRAGPEAESARRFAADLARVSGLEVDLLDERWTTREAERALGDAAPGRRRKRRQRGDVDSVAATLILRTWLQREDSSNHE